MISDVFDESNINRQILALSSTVGRKKTEVARERVLDINPDCDVKIIETFVNADTLPQLLAEPVDYVVDAIDALNPKCCLMETLYRNGIPFISSMGAALKTDVSRIGCAGSAVPKTAVWQGLYASVSNAAASISAKLSAFLPTNR